MGACAGVSVAEERYIGNFFYWVATLGAQIDLGLSAFGGGSKTTRITKYTRVSKKWCASVLRPGMPGQTRRLSLANQMHALCTKRYDICDDDLANGTRM